MLTVNNEMKIAFYKTGTVLSQKYNDLNMIVRSTWMGKIE